MKTLWIRRSDYAANDWEPHEVDVTAETEKTLTVAIYGNGIRPARVRKSNRIAPLARVYGAVAQDRYSGPMFPTRNQALAYRAAVSEAQLKDLQQRVVDESARLATLNTMIAETR